MLNYINQKLIRIKKIFILYKINLIRFFLRFLNNYFIEHSYRNPLTNKPLMTKNYYVDLGIKTSKKNMKLWMSLRQKVILKSTGNGCTNLLF